MRLLTLVSILIVLFACTAKAPDMNESQRTDLLSQIEANMDELKNAAEEMSTSGLKKYLAPGNQRNFMMAGIAFNKDELIAAIDAEYAGYSTQTLTVLEHSTKILSSEAVIWYGVIAASGIDKAGIEESLHYTDTWLWEKSGDSWQVSHMHESWE